MRLHYQHVAGSSRWVLGAAVLFATRAVFGQDATPPNLSCPVSILTIAERTAEGLSLAANLSCYVYTTGAPVQPPGECVVVASDNVAVTSVTEGGDFLLPPGSNELTFVAEDAAGNSRRCVITVVVSTRPEDSDVLNFMQARALATSSIAVESADVSEKIAWGNSVLAATALLQGVTDPIVFDDLSIAVLRLSQSLPASGIPESARNDLLSAANEIARLRLVIRRSISGYNISRTCGNGVCQIDVGESCMSCPVDCSAAVIASLDGANESPCTMGAAVQLRGTDVSFGVGRRFDSTVQSTPLNTHSVWDPLPAGFGVVPISLDVDRTSRDPQSTDVDYRLEIIGLTKRDIQSGLIAGQYSDPSVNGAVPGHAFAGVTFAVTFQVQQTGSPTPRMRLILDLSVWDRKVDSSSQLSVWYLTSDSEWQQCSGRLALDTASLVYNASMLACFSGIENSARQFALFIETSVIPFMSVEDAYATTVGLLLSYDPPSTYYGELNRDSGNILEGNFKIAVQQSFPTVIALQALQDSAVDPVWSIFTTTELCVVVDYIPFQELGNNQYILSRDDANSTALITFPSASSLQPLQSAHGFAANQPVVFGAILHQNVHRDITSTTEVHSNHALNMFFMTGQFGQFVGESGAVVSSRDILVTFTESSTNNYDEYNTRETYRRCANLTFDAEAPVPLDTVAWTEDNTIYADPNGTDTVCSTRTFGEVGWFFPVVTSTTTLTTTTTTTSSVTSTTSTVTTTTTSTTFHPRHETFASYKDDYWHTSSQTTLWIILGVILLLLICAATEVLRYRHRVVSYESLVGTDALHSLPMVVDSDLKAIPFTNFMDYTWIGRHVSCLHYCYRTLYRHVLLGLIFSYKALIFGSIYPRRPTQWMFLLTSTAIAVGSCGFIGYDRDSGSRVLHNALPREWIHDTRIPAVWMPTNNTVFMQVNGSYSFVVSHPDTIHSNTLIYTDGILDGFWTAVFALPILLFMSFAQGKFHGYLNVVRLLSPARFRATYTAARTEMEKRGVPASYWITRAKGERTKPSVDSNTITVQPGPYALDDVLEVKDDIKALRKVHDTPAVDPAADLAQGYLEMEIPDTEEYLDGVVPREQRGLGWGEDSIMGDDHAISGAGLAIEQDRDSLMDYQTGAEYEAEFNPEIEEILRRAHSWRLASTSIMVLAVIYGIVGAYFYFQSNDNRTNVSQAMFMGGLATYGVVTVLVYAPLFLLFTVVRRSIWRKPPQEHRNAVDAPDFWTVVDVYMMC